MEESDPLKVKAATDFHKEGTVAEKDSSRIRERI